VVTIVQGKITTRLSMTRTSASAPCLEGPKEPIGCPTYFVSGQYALRPFWKSDSHPMI
jgi:hypothetical protein